MSTVLHRRWVPVFALLALLAACTGAPDSADSAAPTRCVADAPDLSGTEPVGYRSVSHDYALPWDQTPRTIGLNVWYPTEAPTEESARYIGIWNDANARVDSPISPANCLRPLVLYSHGSQAWGGSNSLLLEHFVRNGWIAAGPDHTDNLLSDDMGSKPVVFPLIRATDVLETLDWLENLPDDDPLAGKVDTSRVLVLGHSFGGQTSWLLSGVGFNQAGLDAACAEGACTEAERAAFSTPTGDDRIVAVGPMAGSADSALVNDATWAQATPVLYQTGTADNDGSDPYARAAAADVRWLEIEGACHESFTATDLPCDTLPKDEGAAIVAAYTTAFGWASVLQSEAPDVTGVLDGSVVVSTRVAFHHTRYAR
jgi:predicted dienelactone hydrolase